MNDRQKIIAAIDMLRRLKRMVGFFMKRDISELIVKLEEGLKPDRQDVLDGLRK